MPRPRGRPRQFDEEEVRQAILQTFWEKGFAATSLDELANASGLVRPSLYAAFGSKSDMYLMSMDGYLESLSRVRGALSKASTAQEAIEVFLLHMLDVYTGDSTAHQLGCFLVGTALTESPSNPEIRRALASKLLRLNQLLAAALRSKAPNADPDRIQFAADQAAATLHSLAVRSRAGEDKDRLRDFARRSSRFITAGLE